VASSLSNGSKARKGEKHGWYSLNDYLWQHVRRLEDYDWFVEDPPKIEQDVIPVNDEFFLLRIKMVILCKLGIKLTVEKWAEVEGGRRKVARTVSYSYNASSPQGNILRYDNIHQHKGHSCPHHKHVYDKSGNQVKGSPFPIEEGEWPHIHEVVEELVNMFTQENN
jgi:hypothetical protein